MRLYTKLPIPDLIFFVWTLLSLVNTIFSFISGIRNYQCDVCSKAFKTKRHLVTHLNIHYDIRNHKCTICDRDFVQKTSLNVHMKAHKNKTFKAKHWNVMFKDNKIILKFIRKYFVLSIINFHVIILIKYIPCGPRYIAHKSISLSALFVSALFVNQLFIGAPPPMLI